MGRPTKQQLSLTINQGKRSVPLPEALPGKDGEGWKVTDSPIIALKKDSKEMTAPYDTDEESTYDKAYAIAKAKWTVGEAKPEHKAFADIIQAIDDGQVRTLLASIGIPQSLATQQAAKQSINSLKPDRSKEIRHHLLRLMSVGRLNGYSATYTLGVNIKDPIAHKLYDAVSSRMAVSRLTYNDIAGMAERLNKFLEYEKQKQNQERDREASKEAMRKANLSEQTIQMLMDGLDAADERIAQRELDLSTENAPWGKMTTVKALLNVKIHSLESLCKRLASEEGTIMKHPHRLLCDGKIFTRKLKAPGASVLIDVSGSMSLRKENVRDILLAAPASIVAYYYGDAGAVRNKRQGMLKVVAKNGKMCDLDQIMPEKERSTRGNNVVDIPALQWLAKQAKPRIWVSDGMASGEDAKCTPDKAMECQEFIKKNDILQILYVRDMLKLLDDLFAWRKKKHLR